MQAFTTKVAKGSRKKEDVLALPTCSVTQTASTGVNGVNKKSAVSEPWMGDDC